MTVVCYINKLYKGGAERVLSNIANELANRGYTVVFVTDYFADDEYPLSSNIKREVLDGRFEKKTLTQKVTQSIRRIFQLRRICKDNDADVMVSFIREANQRAILATRLLPVKNIISVRIDPKQGYKSHLSATVANYLYGKAEGCVFQTEEAANFYSKKVRAHSKVILNPISDEFYNIQSEPMREETIVTCGRLTSQKNHKLLIDAFSKFHREHPAVRLYIYGEGPLKDELQNKIDSLQLQESVKLMGRCNDIPRAINRSSLFVLSSDFEGLPNALMEAMALGLPVISTDCSGGGARVLIDHEENGILVPCGNVDELHIAMSFCFDNPEAARAMGAKAKEKAKSFTTQSILDDWEVYIKRVVDGRS